MKFIEIKKKFSIQQKIKKMNYLLRLSIVLIASFAICSCASKSNKAPEANEPDDRGYVVKVGQTAPDFTTLLMDSTQFTLSEQRGKVVMLQFTASWCGVCRKKMPHIENEIWLPLKDKGLVVVGVDRGEPIETVIAFAEKMEITYPLALDEDSEIFGLYAHKNVGVTRNVVIDKEGKIAFLTRLFDEEEFKKMIETIEMLLEK